MVPNSWVCPRYPHPFLILFLPDAEHRDATLEGYAAIVDFHERLFAFMAAEGSCIIFQSQALIQIG